MPLIGRSFPSRARIGRRPPPVAAPGVSTIVDNFDDNTVNTTLWPLINDATRRRETGGRLGLKATGDTQNTFTASAAAYSFDAVYVRVLPPATLATIDAYQQIQVYDDGTGTGVGTDALMAVSSNGAGTVELAMRLRVGFTVSGAQQVIPYDATNHAWWRVRRTGGSVLFDTAPDDGTGNPGTWTNRHSIAEPGWAGANTIRFHLEAASNTGTVDWAEFDGVNTAANVPSVDATATPATVAAVAAVGTATVKVTALPATVAGTTAVPAPAIRAVAVPATVAGLAAVTGTGRITVVPATVTAVTSIAVPAAGVVRLFTTSGITYTLTGLTPGGTYSVSVRAFDAAGNVSGWSAPVTFTTGVSPDVTISPATVTGATAVGTPAVRAVAVPATVAGAASVGAPQVTTGAGATPATVAATTAIGAPAPAVTVTPPTVAGTATVGAPVPRAVAQPATVAAITTVPAAPLARVTVLPPTVPGTAAVGAPAVVTAAVVPAVTVPAVTTINTPGVGGAAAISPATVGGTTAIPPRTPLITALATPTTVAASTSITGTAQAGTVRTPATVAGAASIPPPIVRPLPATVTGTAAIPAPVTRGGATILAVTIPAAAAIFAPIVTSGYVLPGDPHILGPDSTAVVYGLTPAAGVGGPDGTAQVYGTGGDPRVYGQEIMAGVT
jgi:hypothetical protein